VKTVHSGELKVGFELGSNRGYVAEGNRVHAKFIRCMVDDIERPLSSPQATMTWVILSNVHK
jgi:hypothetical protein